MTDYAPYKKGTLWIPSGPNDTKHLFVVMNDKCDAGCHLIVNVTSINDGLPYDATCVLNAGDHPAITKSSYVFYALADIQSAERLTKMVRGWMYRPAADVSGAVFEKILAGFATSEQVKKRITKYIDGLEKSAEPSSASSSRRDELIAMLADAKAQRLVAMLAGDNLKDSLLELRIGGLERLLAEAES